MVELLILFKNLKILLRKEPEAQIVSEDRAKEHETHANDRLPSERLEEGIDRLTERLTGELRAASYLVIN